MVSYGEDFGKAPRNANNSLNLPGAGLCVRVLVGGEGFCQVKRRLHWFAPGVQLGVLRAGMRRPLERGRVGFGGGGMRRALKEGRARGAPVAVMRAAPKLEGKAKSCITAQVRGHATRLFRPEYLEGAFNYSMVAQWALAGANGAC